MKLFASDYDKAKYFRGPDLDRAKKFRIKIVTEEALTDSKGKTEEKLCLWFTNDPRGLPLNKTNLRFMKSTFGDPLAGWPDKVVVIRPVMASNGQPGLRLEIPPPKPAAAAAAAAAPPPPVAPAAADPELEPDPKLSAAEEMNDEIGF